MLGYALLKAVMYALAGVSSGVHPHQLIEPLSAAPLSCVSVFAAPAQPASASPAAKATAPVRERFLTRVLPNICSLSWVRSGRACGGVAGRGVVRGTTDGAWGGR